MLGGVIFSEAALDQIPAELRSSLLEVFAELEANLNRRMEALEGEALSARRRHGLEVVPVPPEAVAQWRELEAYRR